MAFSLSIHVVLCFAHLTKFYTFVRVIDFPMAWPNYLLQVDSVWNENRWLIQSQHPLVIVSFAIFVLLWESARVNVFAGWHKGVLKRKLLNTNICTSRLARRNAAIFYNNPILALVKLNLVKLGQVLIKVLDYAYEGSFSVWSVRFVF